MENKYNTGRYQARMTVGGPDNGYYEIVDTESKYGKIVGYGYLSLQDAYNEAFQMNEREAKEAARKAAIAHNGLDW